MKYILIDCSSLAYAAFYSYGHLSYNEEPTGVIFGFLEKILTISYSFKTRNIIFCWDSILNLRKEAFWDYKRKRDEKIEQETEEEILTRISLQEQRDLLRKEIIPNLGFKNSYMRMGYEADDILGFLARKLRKRETIMVTGDCDLYQCLNYCKIFNPTKNVIYTKDDFKKDYGINPSQWAMAKAIGGCRSDNVPGILGIGDPKNKSSKAIKYMKGELIKGKIYERINSKEGQAIIDRNLSLVTVPYKHRGGEEMKRITIRRNSFEISNFISVFEKYGFHSFLKKEKLKKWKEVFLQ